MIIGTITLLTIIFLGGGSGDFEYLLLSDGDKIIKEVVVDKDLQKKVLDDLKPLRKSVDARKSNVEKSLKLIDKLSMEYEDKLPEIKAESKKIMDEIKAAEKDIAEGRVKIASQLDDETWEALLEAVDASVDEVDVPDIESAIFSNLDQLEIAVNDNINDEARRTRIFGVLEEFRSTLTETLKYLNEASPSANQAFRDKSSSQLDLEKSYYPLNASLTKTLDQAANMYDKARNMAMKSEWDTMVADYKGKAKSK